MTTVIDISSEETEVIVSAAARAALTVIARTVPLDPDDRGEHFRGLHAAHASFRKAYTSHMWPKDRQTAVQAWVVTPVPDGSEDYREGYQDFTDRISRILGGDPYAIAGVLDEDLSDLPLERITGAGVAL